MAKTAKRYSVVNCVFSAVMPWNYMVRLIYGFSVSVNINDCIEAILAFASVSG